MIAHAWIRTETCFAIVGLVLAASPLRGDEVEFRRGDVNVDGVVDSGDVFVFDPFLDLWIWDPPCEDAVDVNDDGIVTITDMVALLSFLFLGGPEPAAPGPLIPGTDPTPDDLDCETYSLEPMEPTEDFTLGFDGPLVLAGAAPPFRGVVFATLRTEPDARVTAVGWSIRVELDGDGLRLTEASTDGTIAAPQPEGRRDGGFGVTELLPPAGGSAESFVARSSVILSFIRPADPPLGSTERILRLTVESSRPPEMPDADQVLGRLSYLDGEQPTEANLRNVVHCRRSSKLPQLQDCEISLELADAWQLPGDCSQDGKLDLSDSICLLSFLFLGQGEPPCGPGNVGSGGLDRGSLAVLDSNGDGQVDISDAVHVLGFLFLGTEPPTLGTACIRVSGCPSVCR